MYDSEMYVLDSVRAGAAGYLTKEASRELLCHSIRAVVDGGSMVRSALLRRAVEELVKKYVQSVIGKLNVSDRTQAAILGVRPGLAD